MTSRSLLARPLLALGVGLSLMAGRTIAAQAPKPAAPVTYSPQEDQEFRKGTVSFETPGVVVPTVVKRKDPNYPLTSIRQKIKGDVILEAVIGVDGKVEKARVKVPLHPSLDFEALKV